MPPPPTTDIFKGKKKVTRPVVTKDICTKVQKEDKLNLIKI